jgi:hypothetical protein
MQMIDNGPGHAVDDLTFSLAEPRQPGHLQNVLTWVADQVPGVLNEPDGVADLAN